MISLKFKNSIAQKSVFQRNENESEKYNSSTNVWTIGRRNQ